MSAPMMKTEDLIPIKTIDTRYGQIYFYCAGRVCLYRADTFFTKEPETLAWIDVFKPGEVLWDIGANVGTYSVYAARKGCRVLCFEPSAFNYFILMKNVHINRLDDVISAFCLSFSDVSALSSFAMRYLEVGDSCHELTPFRTSTGDSGVLRQATLTLSMDDFVYNFHPPFPNHIKIDVDGVEGKIIKGGARLLRDPRLKSILIELDEKGEYQAVAPDIEAAGFKLAAKERAPQFAASSLNNCIFVRKE